MFVSRHHQVPPQFYRSLFGALHFRDRPFMFSMAIAPTVKA
ncbi:MAG: hypothetical protein WBA57_05940 [Elainellaceae cyanobacterium]